MHHFENKVEYTGVLEEILFWSLSLVQLVRNISCRDVMLLEIENVFMTAGEVHACAAGQRSWQGGEEPQQPESVSGTVLIHVPWTFQMAEHFPLQCVSLAALEHPTALTSTTVELLLLWKLVYTME